MEFLADMDLLAIGYWWNKITSQWAMNILFIVATAFFVVWIGIVKFFKKNKD